MSSDHAQASDDSSFTADPAALASLLGSQHSVTAPCAADLTRSQREEANRMFDMVDVNGDGVLDRPQNTHTTTTITLSVSFCAH